MRKLTLFLFVGVLLISVAIPQSEFTEDNKIDDIASRDLTEDEKVKLEQALEEEIKVKINYKTIDYKIIKQAEKLSIVYIGVDKSELIWLTTDYDFNRILDDTKLEKSQIR